MLNRVLATLLLMILNPLWTGHHNLAAAVVMQATPSSSGTSANNDVTTLELGKAIERKISAAEAQTYQLLLAAGQFATIDVEQRDIDLVVRLIGTSGKPIGEFDSEIGNSGEERVELAADTEGFYRLIVEAKGPKATGSGGYAIRVAEVRAATQRDRSLQEARGFNRESAGLRRAGKYDDALAAGQRGLEIVEGVHGPEHPEVAVLLNNLALAYQAKGEYARAEQLHQRGLDIREKTLGREHIQVSFSLNNLGYLFYQKGETSKAEPLYRRALDIKEKVLGREHIDLANSINNLAIIHSDRREFIKAEALFSRALEIRERTLGSEHLDVAASFNNLAVLYGRKGDYTKAEYLNERALAIREKTLPPEHPSIAVSLNNLANVLFDRGDYVTAERLNRRALEMREKTLGPDHVNVAFSLNNLAEVYRIKGDFAGAEPLYERALKIKEKVLGLEHADVASSMINLAHLYYARHDLDKAESLYSRARIIYEKAHGPDNSEIAYPLEGLALVATDKGNGAQAEQLHQLALEILEKSLGQQHPRVATILTRLATLYAAKGDSRLAIAAQRRAHAINEHNIAINLAVGSEREKLAYLASLSEFTDRTLSLHLRVAPDSPEALRVAATSVIERKGRVLDVLSDSLTALRGRLTAEDQALLDTLNDTTTRLSGVVLGGPQRMTLAEHQAHIKALAEQREELESEISRRTAGFYRRARPITLAGVQAAIPDGAALVEFAVYRSFDPKAQKAGGELRYVAYVLRRHGDVTWKDIGEAKAIDRAVSSLRGALHDPKRNDVKRFARELDEKILQPIRGLLGDATQLLISPDGELSLIPFEALVDEAKRFLIERYSISYLTSARDLLRVQAARVSNSQPIVLANPLFGEPEVIATAKADAAKRPGFEGNRRQPGKRQSITTGRDLSDIYFAPLAGTALEAQAIKAQFAEARVLVGGQATESSLKQVAAPRILHIATHGFFLNSTPPSSLNLSGESTRAIDATARIENPLLRSGLALAHANLRKGSSDDDGILTALEATGLNLWGTKLVVLSACDTGVGEVKNGEGVYGLRRAFVLAGTETLVMSLWPVSDYVTRELMTNYYKGLKLGLGRGEALRQVQLAMLKRKGRDHPFYWASFIQSGEWASLEAKR